MAGGTAAAAYLDAKFHLRKDFASIYRLHSATKQFTKAGTVPLPCTTPIESSSPANL